MTGEVVVLRPAQPGEEGELSDLAFRAKASHGYDAEFMEACRAELTFTAGEMGGLVVAEVAGSTVGVVGLQWHDDAEAEISDLWVEPDRHGQGIGRILVEDALSTARASGAATVRVEADPGAAPFYARMGFVTVGTAPSRSIPQRRLPLMRTEL